MYEPKMRTSPSQFELMVEFMERNGDLNRPGNGPQGRLRAFKLWQELCSVLNMDTTGPTNELDKWKKVWSDMKNNTKKKAGKIYQATDSMGSRPTLTLSDLEERVLVVMKSPTPSPPRFRRVVRRHHSTPQRMHDRVYKIVNSTSVHTTSKQSLHVTTSSIPTDITEPTAVMTPSIHIDNTELPRATTPTVPIDSPQPPCITSPSVPPDSPQPPRVTTPSILTDSPQPPRATSPSVPTGRTRNPRLSQRRVDAAAQQFLESDERWQNMFSQFTAEHLRLRELELQQQAQWQTLFSRFMDVMEKFT